MSKEEDYRTVLKELIEDINSTGGVTRDRKGYPVPAADEDWIDLGMTYLNACAALGVEPKWAHLTDEEEVEQAKGATDAGADTVSG